MCPFHSLLLFYGSVQEIPYTVLKDDGASTKILSKEFYRRHKDSFKIMESNVSLAPSQNESDDADCGMTNLLTVEIGEQKYESKFVLADTIYGIIFGTLLHKNFQPQV